MFKLSFSEALAHSGFSLRVSAEELGEQREPITCLCLSGAIQAKVSAANGNIRVLGGEVKGLLED